MGGSIWLLVEVDESEVEFRIAGEDGFDFDFVG
jgi:hypothetical protein